MKKCPSCDQDNQEQSLQCEYCGEPLNNLIGIPDPGSTQEIALSVLSHMGGLLPIIFSPFVPLVIWLFHRHKSEVIVEHAKKAFNFQLTVLIYIVVADLLRWVMGGDWSFFLIQLCVLFNFICSFIAGVQVIRKKEYNYPLSLQLIP